MIDKSFEVKKASQKIREESDSINCLNPGSVSRLAGSAHRWVELYAGGVQRKTTESQTDCSGIGNNRLALSVHTKVGAGGLFANRVEHDRNGADWCYRRLLVAVSVLFGLFRATVNATGAKQMHPGPRNKRETRGASGLRGLRVAGLWAEISLCLFQVLRGRFS
jgi:hypothetical protein